MDPQIVLFRRQYLQLFEADFLAWPPKQLLRDPDVQAWLYKNLFNTDEHSRLPSDRYQLRVLKPLLSKIEHSIEDPEEDVGGVQPFNHSMNFHLYSEHTFVILSLISFLVFRRYLTI